jgi:hypothetical protein
MEQYRKLLSELDIHDKPLYGLNVLYEKKQIELTFLEYDENSQDYNSKNLVFDGVKSFQIPFSINLDDQEIKGLNVILKDESISVIIEVFMGFSQPICLIEIEFTKVLLR